MFTPTGLFRGTACPKGANCELANCIFAHEDVQANGSDENGSKAYDPFELVPDVSPPPTKRRKIEPHDDTPTAIVTRTQQTALRIPRAQDLRSMIQHEKSKIHTEESLVKPPVETAFLPHKTVASNQLRTVTKPITPPPLASKKAAPSEANSRSSTPGPVVKESLIPRHVQKSPALHSVRNQSLQLLFAAMLDLNKQVSRGLGKGQGLSLSSNELTKLALDEEEQTAIASETSDSYRLSMGRRIQSLKKMHLPEWLAFLTEKLKKTFASSLIKQPIKDDSERTHFSTGLPSAHEETVILHRLRTPLEGLETYGFVTSPPSDHQITAAKQAVHDVGGYEKCDRCDSRFQVFPGRNEAGLLTTGGTCLHHWGKSVRHAINQEAYYSCCKAAVGTLGCTVAETHVFVIKDPARLAAIWQFERTPQDPDTPKKTKPPVTFDCEMGYTTFGLELIRLTAVSWPAGEALLDVLVRPHGEILDLNTRFSGVSKAQWAGAIAASSSSSSTQPIDINDGTLRMVPTPTAARSLLLSLLTPSTPSSATPSTTTSTACG